MAEVIKEINMASNNNAIFVTDVGQHQMVACRMQNFNQTKVMLLSGGLGTMVLPLTSGYWCQWVYRS